MDKNSKSVFAAIDPGSKTGLALCSIGVGDSPSERLLNGRLEVSEWDTALGEVVKSGIVDEIEKFFREETGAGLGMGDSSVGEPTVVMEDFILRTQDMRKKTLDPLRVMCGIVEVLRDRGWSGSVVFQQPSQAKTIATNERLRRWGLWQVGKVHGRDAVRHAVVFLRSS